MATVLRAVVVAALVALLATPALAQGDDAVEASAPATPVTAPGPEVPMAALDLKLLPLTREEVGVELDAWYDALRAQTAEISRLELEARAETDEARQALLDRATAARETRAQLLDRLRKVLDAFKEKGGDGEKVEQYADAVSGLQLDATDAGAAWSLIRGWAISPTGGLKWARNIALFLVTLVAFWIFAGVVASIVRRAVARVGRGSDMLQTFLVTVVRSAIRVVGVVVALSMLEVNVGPLVAAIGAAGLVLGFALQGTLSNFASGVMILVYRPFDIGDFITAGGTSGTVHAMTLVSTTLRTPDNQVVIVPNSSIWGDVITNVTGSSTRRIDLVFGIGYDDDMEKARSILEDVANAHEQVLDDPAVLIAVHELGDSSVNLVCRPWVRTSDYWSTRWDLIRTVKERFDAAGISIPFPQRDVHLHQHPPSGASS